MFGHCIPSSLVSGAGFARTWQFTGRVAQGLAQRRWNIVSPPLPDRLQRREQRLVSFVERLELPRLDSVTVGGETYELPTRSLSRQCKALSQSELEYLVGFFDGDGCVTSDLNFENCSLRVCQSVDSIQPLAIFHEAFGGTMCRGANGRGFQRPLVLWRVSGTLRRRAASLLGSVSSLKQEQLRIASLPRPTCKVACADLGTRLRSLKRTVHPSDVVNSWAYVSGFFDAEGCIVVPSCSCSIQLEIAQAQAPVLLSLQKFVAESFPDAETRVYKVGKMYRWVATRNRTSRFILENMLRAGLVAKRRSAELALHMTPSTHLRTRDELASLKGNQSARRRLDADGCTRAQNIQKIRALTRRRRLSGDKAGAMRLQNELNELIPAHRLEQTLCRINFVRRHARMLLRQGATIA